MKRYLAGLSLTMLFTVPVGAHAQGLGLLGGLSYGSTPNANGVLPGTLKASSGFAVGLSAEGSGVLSFGINALYAQRGFTSSTAGSSQKLTYVDVPVYLKLAIPNPLVTPFAFAGPQGSFELNCEGGVCPSGRAKTTFSGVVGAGVKLGILGGLSVQGRYVYGLTNLDYGTVSNPNNYQPRSFMALAGFSF
jgi:hypothetical protein